jgi:type II secretory ATPase GspE/PulE/Tfp pilus assembly ATPase PilB-like protein
MAEAERAASGMSEEFRAAVEQVPDDDRPDDKGVAPPGQDMQAADASPIVRIAHTIIQQAVNDRATKIQVEPEADQIAILFTIDGVVKEAMRLPKHLQPKLVARYKLMADIDVEECNTAQDGQIAISHAGKDYDLRVHSQPAPHGERVTIAISASP